MVKQHTVETSIGQLTVSSLTLGQLKKLPDFWNTPEKETMAERISRLLPAVFESLRHVHQDITMEKLEGGLDVKDFQALTDAMAIVAGFMAVSVGEEKAAIATA